MMTKMRDLLRGYQERDNLLKSNIGWSESDSSDDEFCGTLQSGDDRKEGFGGQFKDDSISEFN